MTLKEFRTWFVGFRDGVGSEGLSKDQWTRLIEVLDFVQESHSTGQFSPGASLPGAYGPGQVVGTSPATDWVRGTPLSGTRGVAYPGEVSSIPKIKSEP